LAEEHAPTYPTITNFAEKEQVLELEPEILSFTESTPLTPTQHANRWLQNGESPALEKIDAALLFYFKTHPEKLKEYGQLSVNEYVDQYFYPDWQGGGLREVSLDKDPFGPKFAPGTTRHQVEMYYARIFRYFISVKDVKEGLEQGIKQGVKAVKESQLTPFLRFLLRIP
jgi:hypothetical protein